MEIAEQGEYTTAGAGEDAVFPLPRAGPEVNAGFIRDEDDEMRASVVALERNALHFEDPRSVHTIRGALRLGLLFHELAELVPIELFGFVGATEGIGGGLGVVVHRP